MQATIDLDILLTTLNLMLYYAKYIAYYSQTFTEVFSDFLCLSVFCFVFFFSVVLRFPSLATDRVDTVVMIE